MEYKWKINGVFKDSFWELIKQERKFTDEELNSFIHVKKTKFRNPNKLPNIDIAIKRTQQAIDNHEKIMIAGDYDCDGVTATSIMVIGLSSIGADVDWVVPKRVDGYGLNTNMIQEAIDDKVKLIITVDNGIAAHEAIKMAKDNGIEVIVTDHHQFLSETLPCDIVVDPFISSDYEFKSICGCMIAYKFLRMLIPNLSTNPIHKELVALTTFATIADVMPLIDENRKFVTMGLDLINQSKRIGYGVDALIKEMKLTKGNISSMDIAFYIAPCINAIGRIETADYAVQLFLADDEVSANHLAKKAVALNNKRKYIQSKVIKETEINKEEPFIIQTFNEDKIPAGILGIIAGRFASKYQKPCFALHEHNGKLSGSGRNVMDYDISKCVSENFDLVKGGGHTAACGVSLPVDKLEEFKKRCCANYSTWLESATGVETEPTIHLLAELDFDLIDDNLMRFMSMLEPFGAENPEPKFCTKNVTVNSSKVLGKTKNTVKFTFNQNGKLIDGVCFNDLKDCYVEELKEPTVVDIAYNVSYNYWMGRRTIQLMLVDIKKSQKK